MKNKKRYFFLICMFFLMTGCVREKVDITVNKDKSMHLNMDIGISKTFMEAYGEGENGVSNDLGFFDEAELEEMRKAGMEVNTYDDGSYTGVKALLKIKNIDAISSTKEVVGDLEAIMGKATNQEGIEEAYLFTVKKGFLKNTYTAKLNLNLVDETMNSAGTLLDQDAKGNSDTTDYDALLASSMDIGFTINLPYKATSNNATTVENNGKKLTWNLVQFKDSVEFTFELYNRTNLYLLGGGILIAFLLIIFVILSFLRRKKNRKMEEGQSDINRGEKEDYYSIPNANEIQTPLSQESTTTNFDSVPVAPIPVLHPSPVVPQPEPIVPSTNSKEQASTLNNTTPSSMQPSVPTQPEKSVTQIVSPNVYTNRPVMPSQTNVGTSTNMPSPSSLNQGTSSSIPVVNQNVSPMPQGGIGSIQTPARPMPIPNVQPTVTTPRPTGQPLNSMQMPGQTARNNTPNPMMQNQNASYTPQPNGQNQQGVQNAVQPNLNPMDIFGGQSDINKK